MRDDADRRASRAVMLGGVALGGSNLIPKVMTYKLPKDIPWQGDPKGPRALHALGRPHQARPLRRCW